MRAVVVGGNGFIGSHLVDVLLADGWQVVVYDRFPERYRSETPHAVFNIGSGQGTSLNQLLEVFGSVVQEPFRAMHLPDRPFDVPKVVLDVQRARTELEWTPRVSSLKWLNPTDASDYSASA